MRKSNVETTNSTGKIKMKKRRIAGSCLAVCFLAAMLLVGCSQKDGEKDDYSVRVGETISSDSKWVNASIEGAVDGKLAVSPKDDYYTAINEAWIFEQELTQDGEKKTAFTANEDVLKNRLRMILTGKEDPDASYENPTGMKEEILQHDADIVQRFAELAGDWDRRNRQGAEPLRPYLERITSVDSLEEMSRYLSDISEPKISDACFLQINVEPTFLDPTHNHVILRPEKNFVLESQDSYQQFDTDDLDQKYISEKMVTYTLERLGYEETEIRRILTQCYRMECMLSDAMESSRTQQTLKYLKEDFQNMTLEEAAAAAGAYPVQDILQQLDLEADSYTVYESDYLKKLSRMYRESNLELMKSYLIVRNVLAAGGLLDEEADQYLETVLKEADLDQENKKKEDQLPESPMGQEDAIEDEAFEKLLSCMSTYMAGPMDTVYVARYCSREQKEKVMDLTKQALGSFREILQASEWLSEETRLAAVEKLDSIQVRAVYPDVFTDYSRLMIRSGEDASLLDGVADVKAFERIRKADNKDSVVDRGSWDLGELPTTTINAYYMPRQNSINILAGILADEFIFDPDAPIEQNMGRLGTIIGHEITHGFDTNGIQYDKDGNYESWGKTDDLVNFTLKAGRLSNYYGSISPYPGGGVYSGKQVEGEAIADMGGMKIMLNVGEELADFDYEKYFESYAELWRAKMSYPTASAYASADVHPLEFMRANVTLQQFEQFYQTYGVQEEDGMYLDPDKRINVW